MMYRPLQEGKAFAKNGYLADLTSKVSADADWDWKDYQEGPVKATTADGKVVGVPIITEREVLYYRKDLLKAAGLEVPKTMDELEAAAKAIKASSPDTAGFVARTGKSAAVTQFSSFLYSFGGDFTDASGKSAVNTDAAKKAYAFYGGLIKNYGPANVSTDMSWPEAMAIFTQGKAAFYTEADSLYKNATDPAKSKVADTVGFAAAAGRPCRFQAVQHPVLGPRRQPGLGQPGQRLEVHPVGHQQGTHPRRHRRPASPDPAPRSGPTLPAPPPTRRTSPRPSRSALRTAWATTARGRHRGQGPRNRRRPDRRHHHRRRRCRSRRHGPRGLPEVPGQRKEVTHPDAPTRPVHHQPGGTAVRCRPAAASSSPPNSLGEPCLY